MLKKILLLSLAAFATACASQTSGDEAVEGDEAEVSGAASYALTADGEEKLSGSAKAGSPITIQYSLDRLTSCRGNVGGGGPGWNIYGFYSENGGPAKSFEVTKITSTGKDRESKAATIVPSQGGDLALWFQVTSVFGCTDYDSDFGQNFHIQVQGDAPAAIPTITFEKSGAPTVKGELVAGGKVKIHYAQERLDKCESYQGGNPVYGIGGTALLNGQKQTFDTGRAEAGQRVAVDAVLDLPAPGQLELWFETTSIHGCHEYDSNLSANYKFDVR